MDEQKTKYCDMENGCMFCDRLFCEGNIKIGDEVIIQGNYPELVGIVTHNDPGHFCYMLKDGISYHCCESFANPKKTGRYFPEIQKFLDALNKFLP